MEHIRDFGDYAMYKSMFYLLTDLLAFLFLLIVHGSPVYACSRTELVPVLCLVQTVIQTAAMLESQAKKMRDRELTKSKKPSTLKKVGIRAAASYTVSACFSTLT